MATIDKLGLGFVKSEGGSGSSTPTYEGEIDALESFKFKQVFLTKGPDGQPKQLVIPLTVKDPADGHLADGARERLLAKLAAGTKVISHVDIKNLTMTVRAPDGKLVTEAIELDADVRALRAVYGRLAKANQIPVSWDSKEIRSLVCPSRRINVMNCRPVGEMIASLGIQSDEAKKKRAEAIYNLREEMATQSDPAKGLSILEQRFEGSSALALVAAAGGASKDQLEAAVKAETGELEEGFIRGRILRLTDEEITSDEKAYLEDIQLLGVKDRGALVAAYHTLGRPAPQDSFERVLLSAFNTATEGSVEKAVENLCKHPLVASVGLNDVELAEFKTKLSKTLTEAVRSIGNHSSKSVALQASDLDPLGD